MLSVESNCSKHTWSSYFSPVENRYQKAPRTAKKGIKKAAPAENKFGERLQCTTEKKLWSRAALRLSHLQLNRLEFVASQAWPTWPPESKKGKNDEVKPQPALFCRQHKYSGFYRGW